MTVLNFPVPLEGATYTENGITYTYMSGKWVANGNDVFVNKAGGVMTGSVTVPERTITGSMDLSEGPYWTTSGGAIPNPTNAVAGMGGLIRITGEVTSWGNYFYPSEGMLPSGTGNIPFYVESSTYICLGKLTPGA